MDVKTYATIVDLSGRLAGRLSDTVLDAVRAHYFAGEEVIAEAALLLGLAYEGVGVTQEEHDLIRSVLDDPDNPDLDAVAIIDEVPAPAYRFAPTAPPDAGNPAPADELLASRVPGHGGVRLLRTWREPLNGSHGGATWVYLPVVGPDADELGAYSGLSAQLWVQLREKWQVEPVTDGRPLPPYLAAAVAGAVTVWPA
jgi:hypothetical protein